MPSPQAEGFDQLYTLAEIADYCQVTVWTVRDWVKAGRLVAAKVGRAYLVSESDLKTFLIERYGLQEHL